MGVLKCIELQTIVWWSRKDCYKISACKSILDEESYKHMTTGGQSSFPSYHPSPDHGIVPTFISSVLSPK